MSSDSDPPALAASPASVAGLGLGQVPPAVVTSGNSSSSGRGAVPVGLLSPANADLYRRFEAEEAKTSHLRVKEKQQAAALATLTAKLEEVNRGLVDEEVKSAQRTEAIKAELAQLDREEAALDGKIRLRRRQLQTMSTAVADIQVQLAFNFTPVPSHFHSQQPQSAPRHTTASSLRRRGSRHGSSNTMGASSPSGSGTGASGERDAVGLQGGGVFAVNDLAFIGTLTDDEIAEMVGESSYVDETGTKHRVVFTAGGATVDGHAVDGIEGGLSTASPSTASSASPTKAAHRKRSSASGASIAATAASPRLSGAPGGGGAPPLPDASLLPGTPTHPAPMPLNRQQQEHWASTSTAKRATFLLLDNARQLLASQLHDKEVSFESGTLIDAVYFRETAGLKAKLLSIHTAIKSLLGMPTTVSSPSQKLSSATTSGSGGGFEMESSASASSPLTHRSSRSMGGAGGASRGSISRISRSGSNAASNGLQLATEADEEQAARLASAILDVRPNCSEAFQRQLKGLRDELTSYRLALAQEDALLKRRGSMTDEAWSKVVAERDMKEFAESRKVAPVVPEAPAVVAAPAARRPQSARAPGSASCSTTTVPQHANRLPPTLQPQPPASTPNPPAAPSARLRPNSAKVSAPRFAAAAARVLRGEGLRDTHVMQQRYFGASLENPMDVRTVTSKLTLYRMASRETLEAAVKSRTDPTTRRGTNPLHTVDS